VYLGGNIVKRKNEEIKSEQLREMFEKALSPEDKEKFFPSGVTDTVAIELKDFADAITNGSKPEVDGVEGLKDEAICMAVFESAWFNHPVSISNIENCIIEGYQKEINDSLGL